MICHHECGDSVVDVACRKPVPAWRSCGLGCKHEIGYCKDHGGDKRAGKEMVEHHARVHEMTPTTNYFPENE